MPGRRNRGELQLVPDTAVGPYEGKEERLCRSVLAGARVPLQWRAAEANCVEACHDVTGGEVRRMHRVGWNVLLNRYRPVER